MDTDRAPPPINLKRGLRALALGIVGGTASCLAILVGLAALPGLQQAVLPFPQQFGFRDFRFGFPLASPVIGIAAVGGAAGWAAFAPARKIRYAVALALVFALSVPGWITENMLGIFSNQLEKGNNTIRATHFLHLAVPPLFAGCALSAVLALRRTPPTRAGTSPGVSPPIISA